VLSRYYPSDIEMHSFENVTSTELKRANWVVLEKLFKVRRSAGANGTLEQPGVRHHDSTLLRDCHTTPAEAQHPRGVKTDRGSHERRRRRGQRGAAAAVRVYKQRRIHVRLRWDVQLGAVQNIISIL
jgi:hypothetical protein